MRYIVTLKKPTKYFKNFQSVIDADDEGDLVHQLTSEYSYLIRNKKGSQEKIDLLELIEKIDIKTL